MNNIAIFIDGDNISGNHYQSILQELKQEGRVLIQRVYADFSTSATNQWKDVILNHGMEAIQTYRVAKKESTDNALIVDCMDTLYNISTIQKYVIVSSDSDFSSLATKIRLRGLFCIGVGYNHTSLKLRNNCDKFILIENITHSNQSFDTSAFDLTHGIDAFLASVFNSQSVKVLPIDKVTTIDKRFTLQNIQKLSYIRVYRKNIYYLLENLNENIAERVLHILEKSDKDVIYMSYLKDCLLNLDSSFDQRRYGFFKMAEFGEMIIQNTEWRMSVDDKKNAIIII
jgi:hypothetical protein